MIWSLTPFFNELDVLEIRLAELNDAVDFHVIAEAPVTYSGDPKPLHFQENRERFARWEGRIRYVIVDDMPMGKDYRRPLSEFQPHTGLNWRRENHQRGALMRACPDMEEDDLVLLSDVDEIPSADLVERMDRDLEGYGTVQRVYLPQHVMYLNWRWQEPVTVAVCRFTTGWSVMSRGTQAVREDDRRDWIGDPNGWHLSYMGGPEAIAYKIRSAAHGELVQERFLDPRLIRERMAVGRDMFDRGDRWCRWVPIEALPRHVQDNPERFAHLLINDPEEPAA